MAKLDLNMIASSMAAANKAKPARSTGADMLAEFAARMEREAQQQAAEFSAQLQREAALREAAEQRAQAAEARVATLEHEEMAHHDMHMERLTEAITASRFDGEALTHALARLPQSAAQPIGWTVAVTGRDVAGRITTMEILPTRAPRI